MLLDTISLTKLMSNDNAYLGKSEMFGQQPNPLIDNAISLSVLLHYAIYISFGFLFKIVYFANNLLNSYLLLHFPLLFFICCICLGKGKW